MEKLKVGTALPKGLYKELKQLSRKEGVDISELIEEGIRLLLRREAIRGIKETFKGIRVSRSDMGKILKASRRSLEDRTLKTLKRR